MSKQNPTLSPWTSTFSRMKEALMKFLFEHLAQLCAQILTLMSKFTMHLAKQSVSCLTLSCEDGGNGECLFCL